MDRETGARKLRGVVDLAASKVLYTRTLMDTDLRSRDFRLNAVNCYFRFLTVSFTFIELNQECSCKRNRDKKSLQKLPNFQTYPNCTFTLPKTLSQKHKYKLSQISVSYEQ